jgi:hypothetical protein
METPTPVDLNKLKSILSNAKKIMKATDDRFQPKKQSGLNEGRVDYNSGPLYDERDEREPNYPTPNLSEYTSQEPVQSVRDYTEEDIINSKLPPIVKEAMLRNPIPKPTMSFSKFNLDGLEDLIEKPALKPASKPAPKTQIRESINSSEQTINISLSQLNEMIDKRVNEVLANMFAKTLAEQTIKKTIGTLIKEGKINKK